MPLRADLGPAHQQLATLQKWRLYTSSKGAAYMRFYTGISWPAMGHIHHGGDRAGARFKARAYDSGFKAWEGAKYGTVIIEGYRA